MISFQTLLLTLLAFYLLGTCLIYHQYSQTNATRVTLEVPAVALEVPTFTPIPTSYKFKDHVTAYYVLEQLDQLEPIDIKYINVSKGAKEDYYRHFLGTKVDEDYCQKHRAQFVSDPSFIFDKKNIMVSHNHETNMRVRVLPKIGNDMHPRIFREMKDKLKNNFTYDLKTDISSFFTHDEMYPFRRLGKHFSCLTQSSNHILGIEDLYRKDFAAQATDRYQEQYETRPHCFSYDKFFPRSWVLYQSRQCVDFFKAFNSHEYARLKKERNIVYLKKIGAHVHRGQGVLPVDDKEEHFLRHLYKNGTLCKVVHRPYVIQTFIHNPLLLEGHKFDFRVYLLVASTNPVIAYAYDGYVRVSIHDYNTNAEHIGAMLTNTALSEDFFSFAKENGTYRGMNETELRDYHVWSFERLHGYLYQRGIVTDENWVSNYLRPEIRKIMLHAVRLSQGSYLKRSSIYGLLGLDLMLDSNLNLWFIEANVKPGLNGFSDSNKEFIAKMIIDHFEIVFGLLRSRTKRIVNFVNEMIENGDAWRITNTQVFIRDIENKRKEFQQVIMNRFEPEFEPSKDNGFTKIIDENYSGVDRYMGLLSHDCL